MKVALVLSVVLAVTYASVENPAEEVTSYGYFAKIGIPLAENIRKYEETQNQTNRIIDGEATPLGLIPYQAGLIINVIGLKGNGVCGASLVSNNRLVTAAHCWFDGVNQAWQVTVVLGSMTIFSGGVRIETTKAVVHPRWYPKLVMNDIAVIYLPKPVAVSNTISPVALPTKFADEDFVGETGIASGFGRKADGANLNANQSLSHVGLEIISNTRCFIAFPMVIRDSNICTSGLTRAGTCQGDSGGPLTIIRDGVNYLVGITSFGSALGCETLLPAAYVRVTYYLDFIFEQIYSEPLYY